MLGGPVAPPRLGAARLAKTHATAQKRNAAFDALAVRPREAAIILPPALSPRDHARDARLQRRARRAAGVSECPANTFRSLIPRQVAQMTASGVPRVQVMYHRAGSCRPEAPRCSSGATNVVPSTYPSG